MTQPRSSLAVALQDYKGLRPGIAITIAAVALLAAIVIGVAHVYMLGQSGAAIEEGRQTIRTLHSYNAALEVWREMASSDEGIEFPQQAQLRDSIAQALRREFADLMDRLQDTIDISLAGQVLSDLDLPASETAVGSEFGLAGRQAMIVLTARQDSALFRAAGRYQRSQYFAALVIGLAVIAAGILIVPMSWMYVRYKRGVPPGM